MGKLARTLIEDLKRLNIDPSRVTISDTLKASPNPDSQPAKWKAGWRIIGGRKKFYRSRWEANYARYLEWLCQHGQIVEWQHEAETFWFKGIKRGCVSYLPDFRVLNLDGTVTYHEVKGWFDPKSKTKIKRMKKYFPQIKLLVIDSKAYRLLEKQVSGLISGWEFPAKR